MSKEVVHYMIGVMINILDDIKRCAFFARCDDRVALAEFNSVCDMLKRLYLITDEVPF